ncbi:MAG: efflux RND transporter periplasmic adaptor subunit [Thermoanaerobaculia bacterium]|nr:efflux RND transporter periplasmic adaptor subunit [Thermoanaerobaculia bacterium]
MSKKTIIIVLAILVAAAGGWWFVKGRKGKNGDESKYRTQVVDRGKVTMTVTATGTASAVTTVQVGSQVSGVIMRIDVDFNSPVKRGQLLAELDPTPFEAQAQQRRADLEKAKIDLRNTLISLNRQKSLAAQGLSPQADLDAATAQHDIAQAQVEQATAALSQSETNLGYTKIFSPIDGVVAARQYDVGQTVAASFQAPTLFTIAQDLTKMQIQADVDQADIGRIQNGQVAHFTVDAYPEEQFEGKIAQIRLNATVNQNVVTYPVIIEVPNPDEKLRPNMTANVTIDVAEVADVLRVPNAALRFRPAEEEGAAKTGSTRGGNGQAGQSGGSRSPERAMAEANRTGQKGMEGAASALGQATGRNRKPPTTVYVLGADGAPKKVEIVTGITDGRFTQVIKGEIKEGDTVIVGTATSKADGRSLPGAMGPGGGMGGRGR